MTSLAVGVVAPSRWLPILQECVVLDEATSATVEPCVVAWENRSAKLVLAGTDALVLGTCVEDESDLVVLVEMLSALRLLQGGERRSLVAVVLWGSRARSVMERFPHPAMVGPTEDTPTDADVSEVKRRLRRALRDLKPMSTAARVSAMGGVLEVERQEDLERAAEGRAAAARVAESEAAQRLESQQTIALQSESLIQIERDRVNGLERDLTKAIDEGQVMLRAAESAERRCEELITEHMLALNAVTRERDDALARFAAEQTTRKDLERQLGASQEELRSALLEKGRQANELSDSTAERERLRDELRRHNAELEKSRAALMGCKAENAAFLIDLDTIRAAASKSVIEQKLATAERDNAVEAQNRALAALGEQTAIARDADEKCNALQSRVRELEKDNERLSTRIDEMSWATTERDAEALAEEKKRLALEVEARKATTRALEETTRRNRELSERLSSLEPLLSSRTKELEGANQRALEYETRLKTIQRTVEEQNTELTTLRQVLSAQEGFIYVAPVRS